MFLLFNLLPLHDLARADNIRGSLDFNYSNFHLKTEDSSGQVNRQESNNFLQRYTIDLEKNFYPNLRLNGGGLFKKTSTSLKSGDTNTRSSITDWRPFVDLTLKNPLYTARVGYEKRGRKNDIAGAASQTILNEEYEALLKWKPVGLPSLDVQFTRTDTFDEKRSFRNTTTDNFNFSSIYESDKGFDIRYQGSFNNLRDHLNDLKIQELKHTGRLSYSKDFFDRLLSINTSYNIIHPETKITTKKGVEVSFQVSPFSALSAIDDTPDEGALAINSSLIDGDLISSSGINIGLPPINGNTKPRNMGLDFLRGDTELNTILVWVDRELPPEIADSFTWDIYTSPDGENWNFETAVFLARFGPFQNRFEIKFPAIKARYFKIVVKPLSATVAGASNFPNIFVTEMEASLRKKVEEIEDKITSTTQNYELNARTRLLKTPSLYYDLSYFYTRQDPSAESRYDFSNGLIMTHKVGNVFSTNARFAREDTREREEGAFAYLYSAAIRVTPIETFSQNFTYSGKTEAVESETTKRDSFFLQTTAQIYKGININIFRGINFETKEGGEKKSSNILNLAGSFIPTPKLTVNLYYSESIDREFVGKMGKPATSSRRRELSLSYNPYRALFLFASLSLLSEKGETRTTQNYGINWSPFAEGTLQFNFSYNESLLSENEGKSKVIIPSLRWNITRYALLDLSYSIIMSEAITQKSNSNIFNVNLRVFF